MFLRLKLDACCAFTTQAGNGHTGNSFNKNEFLYAFILADSHSSA